MRSINESPQGGKPTGNGRQAFHLVVIPEDGCDDPIRNLKALLKLARRRYRLKCISAEALK